MIPREKIIKLNDTNRKIVVAVKPLGINKSASFEIISNIDNNLIKKINIANNIEKIELIIPIINITLNGKIEKDIKPSNPNKKELKKLNFSFPAFLFGRVYSTPICLNPTQYLKPLKNGFFSLKSLIISTTFFFIKQNSPTCEGISISLRFEKK